MPKQTIREKIEEVRQQVKANNPKGTGARIKNLAVKAIYAGFGQPDWVKFMEEFATTKQQLARLTTRDTDCHDYNEPARAYLVGNATCLPGTDGNLLQGISEFLDVSLQEPASEKIAAPEDRY